MILHVGRAYSMTRDLKSSRQLGRDTCFLGGHPRLPKSIGLPTCTLCETTLAFAMHVEFPTDHPWRQTTVATFVCLACGPDAIWDAIARAPKPRDYPPNSRLTDFETAQTCYRFVCSKRGRGVVRRDVAPAFPFCRLRLALSDEVMSGNLGGLCDGEAARRVYGNLDLAPFTHLFSIGENLQDGLVPVTHKPDAGTPFRLFNIISSVHLRVFGSVDAGVRVCCPYIEL